MASKKTDRKGAVKKRRLEEAMEALTALQFGPKQRNEVAAYTLLALLDLGPEKTWGDVQRPLRGITPIIDFIAVSYGLRYAPNTRETIRDEAVKFFVEAGLLLRNPDKPDRPTNSGNTVYQVELPHVWNVGMDAFPHVLSRKQRDIEARDFSASGFGSCARHAAGW
jgi:hypothetical protein